MAVLDLQDKVYMQFFESVRNVISIEGIVFAGVLFVLFFYIRFLSGARKIAITEMARTGSEKIFSDTELERYSRHIMLHEIGGVGQKKLKESRILIVGVGGLGSPILQYLSAAGVGTIGIIDDDTVSLSNLQRQVIFDENQLSMPKVFAAQERILQTNPHVDILPFNRRLSRENGLDLIEMFDLVLDGTDNSSSRYLVNELSVQSKTPLISGAISQWEGQVSLFDPENGTPCYHCIFKKTERSDQELSCAELGVMGALPGIIGSIMATEAIKWITGAGQTLSGEMLIFDALHGETRKIKLSKRKSCTVCVKNNASMS